MRFLKYVGGFFALFGLILIGWAETELTASYYVMALSTVGGILLIAGGIMIMAGLGNKQKGGKQ